jgi:hypothetical protein
MSSLPPGDWYVPVAVYVPSLYEAVLALELESLDDAELEESELEESVEPVVAVAQPARLPARENAARVVRAALVRRVVMRVPPGD